MGLKEQAELRETTSMIDLSHLTEEEQDAIMMVLQRDAQLKKAEEERVRKLETILNKDAQPDNSLKYFTGEWFYEAKSRRHMDKIHGSEIILASMKQKKGALDGSLRLERSKSPSSQGSDTVPPPKPARAWDARQPQDINHAEKESLNRAVRSPRTLRHNPFNRASLLVFDPPDETPSTEQQSSGSAPLRSQLRTESSQTSGESVTSGSSAGFRPVPKKRTFLSRRPGTDQDLETQTRPAAIVPAPRRSLQRGSSGSSNQSCMKPQDDMSSCQVSVHTSADATSLKQVVDTTQVFSNSSLNREVSRLQRNRESSFITKEGEAADRQDNQTQRQPAAMETLRNSNSTQYSEPENISSVGSAIRPDQLSLTQSIVAADPPISYDLKLLDESEQQVQAKGRQRHAFKLCTQTTTPTGDEDISIAKVLDWFSRSTDSSDWLNTEDEKVTDSSVEVKCEHPPIKEADPISDRSKATLETKRNHSQPHVSEAKELIIGNGEQSHKEVTKETWENTRPREAKDSNNEPPNISHLKSFWEKSNTGPKILISKSSTLSASTPKDNKDEKKSQSATDTQPVVRIPNGIGTYTHATNHKEDKDQLPQKDTNCTLLDTNDHKDTKELLSLAGLEMQPETLVQSRTGPESFGSSFSTNRQTDGIPQSPEIKLPDDMGKRTAECLLQAQDIVESDKLVFSRNTNLEQSGQMSPKTQLRRSSEDMNGSNSEDRSSKPGMPPKRREDLSNKDKSPVLHRQSVKQEGTVMDKERIKHLKSFWEQERTKTGRYTGKPKASAEGKVTGNTKLNKRFAKSEFDLQFVGKDSDSEDENTTRHHQHLSPNLGRRQFKTLREFWDETTSDPKVSFASAKCRSPKRKEQPFQGAKCGDPEISHVRSSVEKTSSRPAMVKSPPPPYNRPKSPLDRQTASRAGLETEVQRSSKDSSKDPRSPKSRKDSFSNSSSRINSFRRATSMFSLSTPDETDQLQMDVSPVHSQSRKQRVNTEKDAGPRRPSEDTETLTPRARAFVPTDYRHYLGMTDTMSVHTSLAPAVQDKELEGKSEYEYDFSGPVRASTPLNSEEMCSRKGSKTCQRPLWPNHSSSDTGQESSVSSASECWSKSRLSSNSENDNDNPVRRALRRAETRPKHLAKSMEDVTATSVPRSSPPSPSSSMFSDPEHMKKMSKSVPSFLHKELSGSVMTMYSADFGSVDVQGSIQFSIHYVQKLKEFHIFVAQCQDLAPVDPKRGRSDPYVKSYLVPDKAKLGKRKTSVKKKTLNPTFNEILRYRVRMEYLRTQTLVLSVWHHDTFGKNSFLGEVDVDLSKWDFDHTQMNYLALKARTCPTLAPSNSRGEMRLAIRFMPQISHSDAKAAPNSGEIHIWVKECKNLPLIRASIDPYVKCFVLPDTSKKGRQKTRVLRSTVDPAFNHTMVYDGIREPDLTDACVELTVLDRDRLASNLLGGLRLGAGTGRSYGALVDWMDSTPYEVALWERMIASPNEWVEDVLPLRWFHATKTTFK